MTTGQEHAMTEQAEIRNPIFEGAYWAARDRLIDTLAAEGFDPRVAAAGANHLAEEILSSPTQSEDAAWLIASMAPSSMTARFSDKKVRDVRAALVREGIAPDIARFVARVSVASPRGAEETAAQLGRMAVGLRDGMDPVIETMRSRLADSLEKRGLTPKIAREISAALPKAAMRADLHLSEAIAYQSGLLLEANPRFGAQSAVQGVIAYRRLGDSAALGQLMLDLRYAPAPSATPEPVPAGVMEAIELSQRAAEANLASANQVYVEALDSSPKPGG